MSVELDALPTLGVRGDLEQVVAQKLPESYRCLLRNTAITRAFSASHR